MRSWQRRMAAADRRFSWHEASTGLRDRNAETGLRDRNAETGLRGAGPAPVEAADEGASAAVALATSSRPLASGPSGPSAASRLADLLRADPAPGSVLSRTA
jgi:hypothetical protein